MDTYVIKIKNNEVEQLPDVERVLFLSFAHFANELRALEKLLLWSTLEPSFTDAVNNGQLTLSLMFLKLIAGKLNEANKLVQQKLYGTVSGKELVESLPRKSKEGLAKINKHFSSGGTVNKIRNFDAFHYRAAEVHLDLEEIPETEFYFQKENSVNNLYYFAEAQAIRAFFAELNIPEGETEKGFKKLQRDVVNVAHWFTILSDQLLTTIIKKHNNTIWDGEAKPVQLGRIPAFEDVRVPWFVKIDNPVPDA